MLTVTLCPPILWIYSWEVSLLHFTIVSIFISHLRISGNPIHLYARHQTHKNVQPHFCSPISVAMTPTRAKWVLRNRLEVGLSVPAGERDGRPLFHLWTHHKWSALPPEHLLASAVRQPMPGRQGFTSSHGWWLPALGACLGLQYCKPNTRNHLFTLNVAVHHVFQIGVLLVFSWMKST